MADTQDVTILLADDEPAIRMLIEAALVDAGYRVLSARNGSEALDVFDEHGGAIDMVITDMRMPYVDGATLIAELQARRHSLKCMCISAYAAPADLSVPVLSKPFSRKDLLRTVRDVLAV